MIMAQAESTFFAGLLEDFYAECEEHMAKVRRILLSLEPVVGKSEADPSLLQDLLRSFHTIKGLSGMVGLEPAEKLSHNVESFLRLLHKERSILTRSGMDALMKGARTVEDVIGAHRRNQPLPDISESLSALEAAEVEIQPESSARQGSTPPFEQSSFSLSSKEQENLSDALQNGIATYEFHFTPSPELAKSGVNVNVVREILQEIGTVIHAVPQIGSDGQISFKFLVATKEKEETLLALQDTGITCRRYEAENQAPVPSKPAEKTAELVPEHPQAHTPPPGTSPSPTLDAPSPAPRTQPTLSSNVVRVDLGKLDELMRLVGELVISRARFQDVLKKLEPNLPPSEWEPLQQVNLVMERQLRDLREGVMRVRMVPIGEIFERMRFVVHDLARERNIDVAVEITGGETEIDKYIVERMLDPLLHMVRNAVSHGYETDEERTSLGKPLRRRVTLKASTSGDSVLVSISDDGRGIDMDAVARRARMLGLIDEDQEVESSNVLDIISHPGFSTRDEADLASGRGIGMTVVTSTVRELGGTISLESGAHQGTHFTVQLPLTLAIMDALIVSVADQVFAVPLAAVREVLSITKDEVTVLENNEIVGYRDAVLPLIHLSRLFHLGQEDSSRIYALVVGDTLRPSGIVVNRILGQREIVVRALNDPLIQVRGLAGATELGDGRVVLILDVPAIILAARRRST